MIGFGPKVLSCLGPSATAWTGTATQPAVLSAAVLEGQVSGCSIVYMGLAKGMRICNNLQRQPLTFS